jgi:hypothetical protein
LPVAQLRDIRWRGVSVIGVEKTKKYEDWKREQGKDTVIRDPAADACTPDEKKRKQDKENACGEWEKEGEIKKDYP